MNYIETLLSVEHHDLHCEQHSASVSAILLKADAYVNGFGNRKTVNLSSPERLRIQRWCSPCEHSNELNMHSMPGHQ